MTSKKKPLRPKMSMSKPAPQATSEDVDELLGGGERLSHRKEEPAQHRDIEQSEKKTSKHLDDSTFNRVPLGHVDRVGEARRRRTLYLPPELDRMVAEASIQRGTRVSNFIADILQSYFSDLEKQ